LIKATETHSGTVKYVPNYVFAALIN